MTNRLLLASWAEDEPCPIPRDDDRYVVYQCSLTLRFYLHEYIRAWCKRSLGYDPRVKFTYANLSLRKVEVIFEDEDDLMLFKITFYQALQ